MWSTYIRSESVVVAHMQLFVITMEVISYPLLFTFLILLLIKLTISRRGPRLPPGPWQLPIIGSLHHMLSYDSVLAHRRLGHLSRAYGPLMHLKLGELSLVVASSAEAAREIMKTQDTNFATRATLSAIDVLSYSGKTLTFAPYGEYWRQLKKVSILELLSLKRVQSFRPIREEEVRNLLHSISSSIGTNSAVINLSDQVTATINNIAARAVIGDRCKDQATFLQAMAEAVELVGGFDLADLFPSLSGPISMLSGSRAKAKRCHEKLDRIIEDILAEHREKRRQQAQVDHEDFVDVLLRLQEDSELQFELSDDSIKAVVSDMFGAGSETSSTVLLWAMSELMRNPRVMKKAQLEVRAALQGKEKVMEEDTVKLSYMHLVIKETLRLHIPVPLLLPRECMKTSEVLGYDVPKNTRVIVNSWAIARDPRSWEDPEEFKPERFRGSAADFKGGSFEFLPFGAGRRMCPGMSFGLANVELPLASLLYHFDWELPRGVEPGELDMGETLGVTARRSSDLCLRAISCIPCPYSES